MSEGWGDDFDEDGNVIGDVPDDDPSFFREHVGKILAVAILVFLFNVPRLPNARIGVVLGIATGSLAVAYVVVYVIVAFRNR